MYIVLLVLALILTKTGYTRYVPVRGTVRADLRKDVIENKVVVDVRDYQHAGSGTGDAIVIPTAYLKRFSGEIPKGSLHLIASSRLEANFSIRLLRRKGFHIHSYTILEPGREKGGIRCANQKPCQKNRRAIAGSTADDGRKGQLQRGHCPIVCRPDGN
ncbi:MULTISPECIES: sulfurtransferase [Heyndrickxia]|jgi:hypothetical protein|uniref:Rhodanese domain-containing protein n=1 Tax=Heyndrickxia coagulans TaxID=1398 RepID=A0A150KB75_HEYCO|nr:hypothetical protein B4100_2552 [Heyndrickxia coagulans]KYC60034.1 hypothetical protein B4098_2332 [Heyndrickxia coagulans]KYC66740.1 hypothetical protein B4099_2483 [Heyndrickxia coagulans]